MFQINRGGNDFMEKISLYDIFYIFKIQEANENYSIML